MHRFPIGFPSDRLIWKIPNHIVPLFLGLGLAIITLADIFSPIDGRFGTAGTIVWLFLWFSLLCYTLHSFTGELMRKHLPVYTFVICLLLASATIGEARESRHVSGETTIEIGCILQELANADDSGWHARCLSRYPARQLLVPALPTILTDRSVWALQTGTAILFTLSVVMFASGMLRLLRENRHRDLLTAIGISIMYQVTHVLYLLYSYEQSILPMISTLFLVGLYLQFREKPSGTPLLYMVFLLITLVHGYTTGLAVLPLAAALILAHAFLRGMVHIDPWKAFAILLLVGLHVAISFTYRTDFTIYSGDKPLASFGLELAQLGRHLFYQAETLLYSNYLFQGFLMFFIACMSLGAFGWRLAAIGWWSAGVLIASILLRGYSYYGIHFSLHRSVIILPVLIATATMLVNSRTLPKTAVKILQIALLLLLTEGVFAHYDYLQIKPVETRGAISAQLAKELPQLPPGIQGTILFLPKPKDTYLIALPDFMAYFLPSYNMETIGSKCQDIASIGSGKYLITQVIIPQHCPDTVSGLRQINTLGDVRLYRKE
ncbi:MAG: hypothetical protein N2691_00020 [Patescibacteria group bacterium]|nr:hypothetical protein [Patescibacteria group bacterium]